MFFRSVCNPIFVGLGTAAIFAAGASVPAYADPTSSASPSDSSASATPTATKTPTKSPSASQDPADDDTPTPSQPSSPSSPSPSPTSPKPKPTPKPQLYVSLSLPGGKIYEGDTITANLHVHASKSTKETRLRLTADGNPRPSIARCASACDLGTVGSRGKSLAIKLTIPKEIKSSRLTVTARFSAAGAITDTSVKSVSLTKKLDPASPSPTPTNTGGSGGGSGGSGGTGSGGGTGVGGGTGTLPPNPGGSLSPTNSQSPEVAFPPITQGDGPTPTVAPGQAPAAPTSVLRSNERPAAQELRFERMASTQAAWLAALLVAFSLLLTQLKLGRRPGGAAAAAGKGAHRRSRRGMFSA